MYKKQIIITIFFLITSFLVSAIPVEAKFSEDQFKSISTLLINNQLDFLNNGQTVPPVFIECTNGIHNQSPRVNSIQQANQVCRDTRNREQLLFNCIRRETTYSCANRVSASQVNQQPSGNVQQEQTRIRETSLNFSPQQFRFQERTFSGECSISNTMNNLAVCRRPDAGSQRYYGCVDSVDPLATVRFNCSVDKGIINTDVNSINDINISQSEFESLENQAFDPGGIGSPVTSSSASTTAGTVTYESYTNFPGVGRISSLCQLITALWLLGFAVLLTSVLGMFLYGGYIYVTAGVNAGKVNQAKEIFTNTITGLIIGLSIFIIINVINPGLLQGNCSIPPIGSTGTGAGQPTLGGENVLCNVNPNHPWLQKLGSSGLNTGPDGSCVPTTLGNMDRLGIPSFSGGTTNDPNNSRGAMVQLVKSGNWTSCTLPGGANKTISSPYGTIQASVISADAYENLAKNGQIPSGSIIFQTRHGWTYGAGPYGNDMGIVRNGGRITHNYKPMSPIIYSDAKEVVILIPSK